MNKRGHICAYDIKGYSRIVIGCTGREFNSGKGAFCFSSNVSVTKGRQCGVCFHVEVLTV